MSQEKVVGTLDKPLPVPCPEPKTSEAVECVSSAIPLSPRRASSPKESSTVVENKPLLSLSRDVPQYVVDVLLGKPLGTSGGDATKHPDDWNPQRPQSGQPTHPIDSTTTSQTKGAPLRVGQMVAQSSKTANRHVEKKKTLEEKKRRKQEKDSEKQQKAKEKRMREKEEKVHNLTCQWRGVLESWSKSSKSSKKVQQLCWEGVPPTVRQDVWAAIVGNTLHITRDLYEINRDRAKELRKSIHKELTQSDGASSNTVISTSSREKTLGLIELDIPRTFPHLQIFNVDGPLFCPLRDILQTYVTYRPDVGYVQGMSYIASMLLLNMDEYEAFVALANILNQDMYFRLFRMFKENIDVYLDTFQVLFRLHIPKLYKKFEEIGIEPSMYVLSWLMTIFSRTLPLDVSHRVYDNFLLNGPVFLYRTALAILLLLRKDLMAIDDMHSCLEILTKYPESVDETKLFQSISKIQIKNTESYVPFQ